MSIPFKVVQKKKPYKIIPGWNDVCRDAHLQARESFLIWVSHGKQKDGLVLTCMTRSRALFKRTLSPYFRNSPLLHITIRFHLTWRLLKFMQWLARKQYLLPRRSRQIR